MNTVVVTGGAGYVGSACVRVLQDAGWQVVVFDDLSSGAREYVPEGVTLIVGDIADETALRSLFLEKRPVAVIHCAAKKAVGESETDPEHYFKTNVGGTLALLSAMAATGVPRLLFSSTAAVYDPAYADVPFTEVAAVAPQSVYGTSKLLAESLIREFARTGKIKQYVIFRYFNVAGDAGLLYREAMAQNVFPLIARAYETGEPFSVFGTDYSTRDGTGVRDYIHVADLADAHRKALNYEGSGTFNLGTGHGYSVRELIASFETVVGRRLPQRAVSRRPGDVASVLADSSLAHSQLGWKATRTLMDMVRDTARVYKL